MRWTAAALAVLLCTACGGTPAPAAPAPSASPTPSPGPAVAPVEGVAAEAVQLRADAAVGGQVQVRVTATGSEPFTVTSVAVDSPGFAPLPDRAVTAAYAPGQTIDLTTVFGEAVCDRAAEPAAARLTVVRPDGRTEVLRVPLTADVLSDIHADTCAARAALAVAGVAVTGLAVDGEAATGSLVLTRAGADDRAVTLTRLEGNVLYDAGADLPRTLDAGADTAQVPVEFTMARCDPHALAEIKQPYRFVLGLQVGEDAEVTVDLPLEPGQRDVLDALVDAACR